jgi:DNA-binding transcriptional ArsR family regulator
MSAEPTIIHLTPDDVTETRFAYSPALELMTSYRVLWLRKVDARFRLWVDEMRRALYNLEFPYLDALTGTKMYIPDFLTPTPLTTRLTIEDEIAQIIATPDELVRKNVLTLIGLMGESEMLHHYLTYPREMLYCLGEELRLYWGRALLHHWSRMRHVLEEDILYRARNLALEGYGKVIADLSPGISYRPGKILLAHAAPICGNEIKLAGQGLQLVPALFSPVHLMWQIAPEWLPMLIYSPRGTGLWWHELPDKPNQSLEIALGAGRAHVLQALATPSNTGELARRLNLTSGAVSQHLSRLRQAGLVDSQRSAKKVYYSLTPRGVQLLLLFDSSTYGDAMQNAG